MNSQFEQPLTKVKLIIDIGCVLSAAAIIVNGILAISDTASIFQFNAELYGPTANNLRIILIYLALTEIILCVAFYYLRNYYFFLPLGICLLTAVGGLDLYESINDVTVDPNLYRFFFITGLAQTLFGIWPQINGTGRHSRL